MKDVSKDPKLSDENLTQLLTENFSGAKAQRFIKRVKTVLNTVKIVTTKET